MSNETSTGYVCPGCAEQDVSEDCFHNAKAWELAEAMRDGVERAHREFRQSWEPGSVLGAWYFADDAMDVFEQVGDGPYKVDFIHPGGRFATVGMVNQRFLIGTEDGEGETSTDFIADLLQFVPSGVA